MRDNEVGNRAVHSTGIGATRCKRVERTLFGSSTQGQPLALRNKLSESRVSRGSHHRLERSNILVDCCALDRYQKPTWQADIV